MSVYKSSQQILSRQFTVSQFFKARKASTKCEMGWVGERGEGNSFFLALYSRVICLFLVLMWKVPSWNRQLNFSINEFMN